ncbi:cysteine hydrolase family protein [Planctomyces sp. SH-PL62]|uniref:cysteine hydrolase family protein n=1 Tax=Planctomyces sp. SH-PL62 TaxID=1636152 RepID=UPI00078E01B3|nr:isochorismatase family cysteine hydrolase [Planctomyces sp. SH-PL62]AMV38884.1 Peroxyureidoacrylate/ureidoacrylate amidohydrolase RutB [Planctomyces sp. SH-PL62]
MAEKNSDLHGFAPDKADGALLLIDVVNRFDFPDAEKLLAHARPIAGPLARLAARARASGVPVVYVNDNFGRWRSDFRSLVEHCLTPDAPGREFVDQIVPEESDYLVIKPKHSGFFSTTLGTLLEYLGARTLILAGVTTDICVLFTANDAYMREFRLIIPEDCVAAVEDPDSRSALGLMRRVLKADVRPSTEIDLESLSGRPGKDAPHPR